MSVLWENPPLVSFFRSISIFMTDHSPCVTMACSAMYKRSESLFRARILMMSSVLATKEVVPLKRYLKKERLTCQCAKPHQKRTWIQMRCDIFAYQTGTTWGWACRWRSAGGVNWCEPNRWLTRLWEDFYSYWKYPRCWGYKTGEI